MGPSFVHDVGRDAYYPSAKLSPVIGQVMRYIEEVERNGDSILAKDKDDTLKIRARANVGRDHTDERAALRNLNAHLHRIEIITFDWLIRIGERVMAIFEMPGHMPEDALQRSSSMRSRFNPHPLERLGRLLVTEPAEIIANYREMLSAALRDAFEDIECLTFTPEHDVLAGAYGSGFPRSGPAVINRARLLA